MPSFQWNLKSVNHYSSTPPILKSFGTINEKDVSQIPNVPWIDLDSGAMSLPDTCKGSVLLPLSLELIRKVFFYLSPLDWIKTLCCLNKYYLLITSASEDWRQFVIDEWHGKFWYIRSWRFTYINEYYRRGFWGKTNKYTKSIENISKLNIKEPHIPTNNNHSNHFDNNSEAMSKPIPPNDLSNKYNSNFSSSNESMNPFRDSLSNMIAIISHASIIPKNLPKLQPDSIDRIHRVTVKEFIDNYSSICKPVIITGAMDDWTAMTEWQKDRFVEKYGHLSFRTDQKYSTTKNNVKIRLDTYYQYLNNCKEDPDPIYIFDPKFSSRNAEFKQLNEEYNVEDYFKEDLLSLLGEKHRPRYKWLVVGSQKSGTDFHIDPYQTSAWNALIYGEKRWAFYPRDNLPLHLRKGNARRTPQEQSLCVDTYNHVPDLTKWTQPLYKCHSYNALKWFTNRYCETFVYGEPPLECIQRSGEIIFVPGSWWHMVLNITDITIAVTQNMANTQNFKQVFKEIWDYDEDMARKLRKKLIKANKSELLEGWSYEDDVVPMKD